MSDRVLVVDANVLLRAVLGRRVADLFERFALSATFLTPATAFDEVDRHLAEVLEKRVAPVDALQAARDKLEALRLLVRPMEAIEYESMRHDALARIGQRDADDWPVLACALVAGCPIWTEDQDFFGTGVATLTTASVEIFLSRRAEPDIDAD